MNLLQFPNLIVFIVCLLNTVYADEDHVYTLQYNVENFAEEIPKYNHFVKFYAPWCSHCQRLAPTWEELAEKFNNEAGNIHVAKVDCTTDNQICNDQGVRGYPTIKFFKIGELEGAIYKGVRDYISLSDFVDEQMGTTTTDETVDNPQEAQSLTELTADTFHDFIKEGKHFVMFHSPYCGHCVSLAPTWEKLAENLKFDYRVKIAKLDCTEFRTLCKEIDIKGYPSLWWIENGEKIERYKSPSRTFDDLKAFVLSKLRNITKETENITEESGDVPESAVLSLTAENFNDNIQKGVTFVKFFAPWCGFCKKLAPIWEELAGKFADNDNVNIVEIECTLDVNKDFCRKEEIKSFPTLHLYKNGNKIEKYTGDRSLDDLTEFVLKYDSSLHNEL